MHSPVLIAVDSQSHPNLDCPLKSTIGLSHLPVANSVAPVEFGQMCTLIWHYTVSILNMHYSCICLLIHMHVCHKNNKPFSIITFFVYIFTTSSMQRDLDILKADPLSQYI